MAGASADVESQPTHQGFQSFDNIAADAILAVSFNTPGTRFATSSADHKLRIYDLDAEGQSTLVEQWRAHDAEILDVKWIDSRFGQFLATIGGDNKFKVWREDSFQAHNSGRRFRCVFSQSPFNSVSYVYFEFTVRGHDIWLALLTHTGLLSLLEPTEPDTLAGWRELDQIYPFGKQPRGYQSPLCLSFHHSVGPSSQALMAGLDTNALSLAVSIDTSIKIFRAVKPDDGTYQLQEMLDMDVQTSLINHIAWAPGPLRPYDVIAVACEDSSLRILNVSTPSQGKFYLPSKGGATASESKQKTEQPRRSSATTGIIPSGIGAGLAGMTRSATASRTEGSITIKHEWEQVAVLSHGHHSPVRKVIWIYDGSALLSTGDDGKIRLWRQGIDDKYYEFAETGPT